MDAKTIQAYDQLAKEYDEETTDFWERFPRTFIDMFAKEVAGAEKGGSVLDVGSGPGRDGVLLQEHGLAVTCLDASQSMVELSTSRGLHSVLGDFMQLPFPDASFDGVWAYTSLLHIPKADIGTALAEIHRVLKPGGVFGLGLIEGNGELYRESSGVKQPRWFAYYQEPEIEALLKAHGFQTKHLEAIQPRSHRYLHFISRKG